MSFEIKPTPNVVDTNEEVIALINANVPEASPTTLGVIFGHTSSYNTSLGHTSNISSQTGFSNVAIGNNCLSSFTSGLANTAVGANTLSNLISGNSVTAVGAHALGSSSYGGNTAVGANAMNNCTTGFSNTALGIFAGSYLTTGLNNVFIGDNAGLNLTTGSNNIAIGKESSPSTATVSNTITLGNASITTLRCQVTSITALSDERDKKNIESLPVGLDFINKLNPVKFDWNMRDGGKIDVPDTGFIAQDLVKLEDESGIANYLALTFRDNPEKLEASYGRLIPILVKAIQELTEEVNKLKENK